MIHNKSKIELEELGYTYQPLYASDIPCANKDIGQYHIWAWLDGTNEIDVTDLGYRNEVDIILNFYLDNKHHLQKSAFFKDYVYMRAYFNSETKECILGSIKDLSPPDGYRVIVLVESAIESLIAELNKITLDIS